MHKIIFKKANSVIFLFIRFVQCMKNILGKNIVLASRVIHVTCLMESKPNIKDNNVLFEYIY